MIVMTERGPEYRANLRGVVQSYPLTFDRTFEATRELLNDIWSNRTLCRAHGIPDGVVADFATFGRYGDVLSEGQSVGFNLGFIDKYAAVTYLTLADGSRWTAFARDTHYLEVFDVVRNVVGPSRAEWTPRVTRDVCRIYYSMRGRNYDDDNGKDAARVAGLIREGVRLCGLVAATYPDDLRDAMRDALVHFFYGMVAEERKQGTKIGRVIKMHGFLMLMLRDWTVDDAANWSRGKSHRLISAMVQEPGVGLVVDEGRERMYPATCRAVIDEWLRYNAFPEPRGSESCLGVSA